MLPPRLPATRNGSVQHGLLSAKRPKNFRHGRSSIARRVATGVDGFLRVVPQGWEAGGILRCGAAACGPAISVPTFRRQRFYTDPDRRSQLYIGESIIGVIPLARGTVRAAWRRHRYFLIRPKWAILGKGRKKQVSIWSEIGIGAGIWLLLLALIMGILWRSSRRANIRLPPHDDFF